MNTHHIKQEFLLRCKYDVVGVFLLCLCAIGFVITALDQNTNAIGKLIMLVICVGGAFMCYHMDYIDFATQEDNIKRKIVELKKIKEQAQEDMASSVDEAIKVLEQKQELLSSAGALQKEIDAIKSVAKITKATPVELLFKKEAEYFAVADKLLAK